jgi:hypothetical protein
MPSKKAVIQRYSNLGKINTVKIGDLEVLYTYDPKQVTSMTFKGKIGDMPSNLEVLRLIHQSNIDYIGNIGDINSSVTKLYDSGTLVQIYASVGPGSDVDAYIVPNNKVLYLLSYSLDCNSDPALFGTGYLRMWNGTVYFRIDELTTSTLQSATHTSASFILKLPAGYALNVQVVGANTDCNMCGIGVLVNA